VCRKYCIRDALKKLQTLETTFCPTAMLPHSAS
jgi:hypothetical protein